MPQIIYEEECYRIIGAAMKVHNLLGFGFLESVYQEALGIEMSRRGIEFEREVSLPIVYDGIVLSQCFRADFICYHDIIVETKAVSMLTNAHRAQVINYLHATGCRLGILINFGSHGRLEWQRIANTKA